MDLNEMQNYQGVDGSPLDFGEFWQREKEELLKIEPDATLQENLDRKFKGFKCYDLWFEGINTSKIYAKCVRPTFIEENKKLPVILLFHGYGGNSGNYYEI